MGLETRIKKLASGLPANAAVDAYVRAGADPDSVDGPERDEARSFEATIEAMFLMAAVDGQITKDEVGQLAASIEAIMDLRGGPKRKVDVSRAIDRLADKLAREGWKARLDTLAPRLVSRESRSFAFRLAAGVAFVDDHVAHAEAAAIDAMAHALGLGSDESQELLHDVQETLFS